MVAAAFTRAGYTVSRLRYDGSVNDTATVICPYCFEVVEVYVDPESRGELIRDCDVCCRPWRLSVMRSDEGDLFVQADRAH